jgi:integrase
MPRGKPRPKIKLTKSTLQDLAVTDPRGERFYDSETSGFLAVKYPSGRVRFGVEYTTEKHSRRRVMIGDMGTKTPDQARREAIKLLGKTQAGHDPLADREEAQGRITVGAWVDQYLAHITDRKRSVRDDRRYLGDVKDRWGSHKLAALTASDVQRGFDAAKQRGHTTANRWLASVRAWLQEGWRRQLVEENVARRVRPLPESPPRARVLSDEELGRLAEAIDALDDPHVRAAFIVLTETGCRLSEILRATWDDFDLRDMDQAEWRVPRPKSGVAVVKPLARATAEVISALPRKSRYVIAGRSPLAPRSDLKRHWYAMLKAAKLEGIRLHDLRRSFGLEVARRVGLHMASKLLGHSDVRITAKVYAPLGLGEQREAAEKVRRARAKVLPFRKAQKKDN